MRLISRRRIDSSKNCWIWTGATREGYGCVSIAGRMFQVARLALKVWRGIELDEKSRAVATCENRACFNPDHLIALSASATLLRRRGPRCCRGHLFTKENTYIYLRYRQCRACRAISKRAYRARNKRRGALQLRAWQEAKGLFHLIGRNGQTFQTVRDSIRPDEQLERSLFSFIGKNSPEAHSILEASEFRRLVLAEFDRLASKPNNRARITIAETEAQNLTVPVASLEPILRVRVVAA